VIEKLRRGELREPAKLPGFLAQIARSLAIEHYRKAQRRKTDPDSDAIAEVEAMGSGPLSELLTREDAGLVRQVIRDLGTERDRDILLRFYIAEEDKERISADFGLSSLQFNRVLHRARERYRDLYLERVGRRALGIILLFVPLSLVGRKAG
jgi:RNA polymerase sigma-70 factor, ECF subfamily